MHQFTQTMTVKWTSDCKFHHLFTEMDTKQYFSFVEKGYTAFGLDMSRKSVCCGWNLAKVAMGSETLST